MVLSKCSCETLTGTPGKFTCALYPRNPTKRAYTYVLPQHSPSVYL